jgi:hypothetical protein
MPMHIDGMVLNALKIAVLAVLVVVTLGVVPIGEGERSSPLRPASGRLLSFIS